MVKGKKIFVISFTVFMSMLFTQMAYARDVKVFYNGREIRYSVPAQIIASRTMVPLSQTFEALVGAGTSWDNATRTSTFYANGHENKHTIGTNIVRIDGAPKQFDTTSLIIGDRALVPIRMIAETSGLTVTWDATNYYVLITGGNTPTPTPTPVPSPLPSPAKPSITAITPDKATIATGESILLTIKTNAATNNVWVNYDGNNAAATYQSTDSANNKAWTVRCTPSKSQAIQIYANTTQSTAGAANRSQSITVTGAAITIKAISASKTTINAAEPVTLTVKTNAAANNVWINCDGINTAATYQFTDSAGDKTWSVLCNPLASQNIQVYANTTQVTAGAVTQNRYITVNSPSSALAVINSVSISPATVTQGGNVTVTAITNAMANYVWASIGTGTTELTNIGTDPSGNKTWSVTYQPTASGEVSVSAGRSPNLSDNTKRVSVTVSTTDNTAPIMHSLTGESDTYATGSLMTFYAETNDAAESVYFSINGTKDANTNGYAYESVRIGDDRIRWKIDLAAPSIGDQGHAIFTVNAVAARGQGASAGYVNAQRSLQVTVTQ